MPPEIELLTVVLPPMQTEAFVNAGTLNTGSAITETVIGFEVMVLQSLPVAVTLHWYW